MRCVVLGEGERWLEVVELPDPIPAPHELLVRVEACGVCHSDLHLADGDWPDSLARSTPPTILGHEIVGTVVARGGSVRSIERGQRVGVGWVGETCGRCEFCREGNDNLCADRRITGIDRRGGWASHVAIHASQAVPVPDGLDPVEAAPLFCAGVTVYRGMKKASIRPGERVAVFGIGGLGHLAVQLAKGWHAETIAIDRTEAKLELGRQVGARHCVSSEDAVQMIHDRGGVHVAVVTAAVVGAYEQALESLRKGGTLVVAGLPSDPLQLLADDLATREIRIIGSAVGSREDQRELLELAAAGRVRCTTESMPLEKAGEALGRLRRGEVNGRLVLVP